MNSFRLGITIAVALGAAALASAQQYDPYRRAQYGGGYYPDPGYGRNGGGYYPDPGYGRNGGYGRYGSGREGGPAYQIGFEDGRRDGERDSYSGHSFRPTHSGNFHHADRGYHREFGPKQFYKDTYRSGYTEGYRTGYGQFRGRRW